MRRRSWYNGAYDYLYCNGLQVHFRYTLTRLYDYYSALFIAPVMSQKIGLRKTICLSILGYETYIAANFAPSWASLIPTAIIGGFYFMSFKTPP